jgi:hypothetical protein
METLPLPKLIEEKTVDFMREPAPFTSFCPEGPSAIGLGMWWDQECRHVVGRQSPWVVKSPFRVQA